MTAQDVKLPAKPRHEILPGVGSERSPHPEGHNCWYGCECQFWWKIRRKKCFYCEHELGEECGWILVWGNFDQVCHLGCQEEYFELEKWWLNTQTVVESAAAKLKITPTNLLEGMASWDRDRYLRAELDQIFPEWKSKVAARLRENRGLTEIPPHGKTR
ncbi:MAG: hypothetical protein KGL39_17615 [Patescibacteria group bacterium]|nr:hypothetical protein [Patescibacteria group bacterium]